MGVAMAMVLGYLPWGSVRASAPLTFLAIDEAQLPAGSTLKVCPIGCAVTSAGQGVLVVTFDPVVVAQVQPMRGVRAALAGVAGL
jgi:hypothetical protein